MKGNIRVSGGLDIRHDGLHEAVHVVGLFLLRDSGDGLGYDLEAISMHFE